MCTVGRALFVQKVKKQTQNRTAVCIEGMFNDNVRLNEPLLILEVEMQVLLLHKHRAGDTDQ